jgi:hypothetical protein
MEIAKSVVLMVVVAILVSLCTGCTKRTDVMLINTASYSVLVKVAGTPEVLLLPRSIQWLGEIALDDPLHVTTRRKGQSIETAYMLSDAALDNRTTDDTLVLEYPFVSPEPMIVSGWSERQ